MMRLTTNPGYQKRALIYFAATLAVWGVLVLPVALEMKIREGHVLYAAVWMLCYAFLSLTTALTFTIYASYFIVSAPAPLPELASTPADKSVAVICTVRNEEVGLYERLKYTLEGNLNAQTHFWLLSDSDERQEAWEKTVINRLRADYPGQTIRYRRRKEHKHFKPGNLAEWLFCHGGRDFDYFFILDADSLMKSGTIEKLLRKAEHPANWDIWHFQCKTAIIHDFTYFAWLQKMALEIHERLVFPTLYGIFGQWISYGHSNLVNTRAYLMVMPPTDELSHDVWDAAALDRLGYRSAIVMDMTVYEEAPANYFIAHKRDKRWGQGSISAMKLLLDGRLSLAQRFFVFQGGVQFINNLVFLVWLLIQFWNMVFAGHFAFDFPVNFQFGSFALNRTLFLTTAVAMITFLASSFFAVRSLRDLWNYSCCLLHSNLIMMNNLVNGSLNVLSILFSPQRLWTPMEKNPFAACPPVLLLKKTSVASLLSIFLWILAWESGHPWWLLLTSPMLLGGIFSPLICWWTGRKRSILRPEMEASPAAVAYEENPESEVALAGAQL